MGGPIRCQQLQARKCTCLQYANTSLKTTTRHQCDTVFGAMNGGTIYELVNNVFDRYCIHHLLSAQLGAYLTISILAVCPLPPLSTTRCSAAMAVYPKHRLTKTMAVSARYRVMCAGAGPVRSITIPCHSPLALQLLECLPRGRGASKQFIVASAFPFHLLTNQQACLPTAQDATLDPLFQQQVPQLHIQGSLYIQLRS